MENVNICPKNKDLNGTNRWIINFFYLRTRFHSDSFAFFDKVDSQIFFEKFPVIVVDIWKANKFYWKTFNLAKYKNTQIMWFSQNFSSFRQPMEKIENKKMSEYELKRFHEILNQTDAENKISAVYLDKQIFFIPKRSMN